MLIKRAEGRHPKEKALIKKAELDVARKGYRHFAAYDSGLWQGDQCGTPALCEVSAEQVDVAYELPVQAVTETIVNAVVHRDYLSTGSVQVMLFKDRLEVWNPGRLPKGMTVEKLNGEHASLPVNPLLANPVYLAGYIEQVGTGTNDVIDRCVELGLRKPEFRQDEDFMVVLWRRGGAAASNDKRDGELNSAQKATLNYYIIENEGCNATVISDKMGVPFSTIDKHIRM